MKQTGRPTSLIVRTAEEAKQYTVMRKVLRALLGLLLIIVTIVYIVSILYSRFGSFTVSINKFDAVANCLQISETRDFDDMLIRLNAKAATDITNISQYDLPDDIDAIDGEHNGRNYVAYTFYVKNAGEATYTYEYNLYITNVRNNVDKAIRFRIYRDGIPTTYARTRSDGGGPERGTEEFVSARTVVKDRVANFGPDDITKFTVVIWVEGDDVDCTNELLRGALKSDMTITVVETSAG